MERLQSCQLLDDSAHATVRGPDVSSDLTWKRVMHWAREEWLDVQPVQPMLPCAELDLQLEDVIDDDIEGVD